MSELHDAVRAWAKGMYPTEAGAELLIHAGRIYQGAPWLEVLSDRRVAIDVDVLAQHRGVLSGGERRVVDVAASLLDPEHPIDLNDAIPGLSRDGVVLVLAAIAHASGSHDHSGLTYDENGQPDGFTRLTSLYPWPGDEAGTALDPDREAR